MFQNFFSQNFVKHFLLRFGALFQMGRHDIQHNDTQHNELNSETWLK